MLGLRVSRRVADWIEPDYYFKGSITNLINKGIQHLPLSFSIVLQGCVYLRP